MTDEHPNQKMKKLPPDETRNTEQSPFPENKTVGKSSDKNQLTDPLVRGRIYPDANKVFSFAPVELQVALEEGLVAVDTNVLLLPYGTGQNSLKQIRLIYAQLTNEKRLRIPGQVAREFADNRAEKLKTLYRQVALKQDINVKKSDYPLLDGLAEYNELLQAEQKVTSAHQEYHKLVRALLERIADWRWDDPVSAIYREFFKPDLVVDPVFDRDEMLKELDYRNLHKIPPGYKDSGKDDSGIGDLVIWKTILWIGETEQKHLTFVTGEEKSDWWYQSNNRALYPRFELVDEYRRASKESLFNS